MPTRYKVLVLPVVDRQVWEIAKYIAGDNLNAAKAFIVNFAAQVDSLEKFPIRAALIPENARWHTSYRHLIYGNYRTIFRVSGGEVVIVNVCHGARRITRLPQ